MTITKTILSAVVLSGLALSASASASPADSVEFVKPLHGWSFDAGSKHAVGYFSSEAGKCHLVLTLAGEPDWNNGRSFSAIRYEASMPAGQSRRYAHEGRAFEFGCQSNAEAMTFKAVEQVAIDSHSAN